MASVKETVTVKVEKREVFTPHRLTVAILIREFCKIRSGITFLSDSQRKTVSNFCILSLRLIQSPDLNLQELRSLVMYGDYSLIEDSLIKKFDGTISAINTIGVRFLLDTVDSIGRLMTSNKDGMVNKNSVIGYYLRRLLINFDKLTFSEITNFFDTYKSYSESFIKSGASMEIADDSSNSIKAKSKDDRSSNREWSRRQAELFIATQSTLIMNNEGNALSPKDLHKHITNLLKSNQDLAEAHFLSYLNYLRVKEYCGAIESLYHCFDKTTIIESKVANEDKSKCYRFAALNLAILNYQFGHREEAFVSLREAIKISQEANDNICLQHALSWLNCLMMDNHQCLMENSIYKSLDLNIFYIASLGIQSLMQYKAVMMGSPKHVFNAITKSDIINCQHSHRDLISTSAAQKSAIWCFYGKTEMSSLWSQLSLYLNTDNPSVSKTYYGEGYCQALCNMAAQLHQEGDYNSAYLIMALAKQRFPNEPVSQIWMLCENILKFQQLFYNQQLEEAESIVKKIAVFDRWESCLRMAELHIFRQDFQEAHNCVNEILEKCKEGSEKFRMDVQVRAMILLSDIQIATSFPNLVMPGIFGLLNSTLIYANEFNIQYLASIAQLHIAHVQLLMKMPAQALAMLERCIVQILAHGGCYDRARTKLLLVKCLLANNINKSPDETRKTILHCIKMLDNVKKDFIQVEAQFRVKDVLYLQACLYNEIDMYKDRNQCSLEYRLLIEDHPIKNCTTLVTYL